MQSSAPRPEGERRRTPWPTLPEIPAADHTRSRSIALNQVLLAGVILALTLLRFAGDVFRDAGVYLAGVILVFVLTAVAMAVPWHRIPSGWAALIPLGDIVAILLMRLADPEAGTGLLWAFPVLWLSSAFALPGFIGGLGLTMACYVVSVVLGPDPAPRFTTLLFPVILVAVGATAYAGARRAGAQRRLLRRQAEVLAQALERSRRQEQMLSEIFDTVDFEVVRIDRDGATAITGGAHSHLHELLPERQGPPPSVYRADGATPLPPDRWPLARALAGEEFSDERLWVESEQGERRALSITVRRLPAANAADGGAVLVSRDVTAEMSAMQERDTLVSSVSHELRTPLTSIIGHIELALDEPGLPPAAASSLEIADRNADRLLALVADVLAASSRAATVALPMEPEDVDVFEIVKASAQSFVTGGGSRNVTIDLSRALPARAYADPLRLRQVVDNLLANAIKYNREGGRVSLVTATRGRKTLILVEDTGVGLDEEDLSNIFQRFYRGTAVRRSSVVGSGLGLSISRDIVRRLGGDISVHSTLGVGSTFTVSIPAVKPGSAVEESLGADREAVR
ncbi:HAMP domain-containing histidine kinase [Microbacterium sp. zg.Y1090]|uniref:sensor histidine kinase n=1 Tax=Microbacterium TaxID=33882 RepID=UPI00214BF2C1|nr:MULTISPECIES: HAMP domain-containing sensor histidine kinase [unclassified Microbacterium]MCR2811481.1 HAMP domain-containing histidine kinase [Microbacterium sp. zg.Y1084]MCR2819100.1 HAMP domain-containing histidine kinase [Microbacterium sp. zg.Y1090]MDL5487901.1 HAMP domain-containing sensor histidine kinase [Microbacterium sp. zg-Y1211]WIM27403.1 HAMP domain-containing sensor histidine kinase [Microbacterium sp. zg-Y1090]